MKKLRNDFVEFEGNKWRAENAKKVATSLVGRSVVLRKNEQSINWPVIVVTVPLLLGIPAVWLFLIKHGMEQSNQAQAAAQTSVATAMRYLYALTASPTLWGVSGANNRNVSTVTPTLGAVFTATAYPTYTPYPTYTVVVSPTLELVEFLYSYYDPRLGGVNCLTWDDVGGVCVSPLAVGLPFDQWYGKAVACAEIYPYWTIFRVVEPVSIRGDYICLDRYDTVTWGYRYIDFLDVAQRLPWNVTVKAEVIYP